MNGVDYSVGKLHKDLEGVSHHQDALQFGSRQRGSNAPISQDSEWSKGCFTLIKLALDPGIESERALV